jgi:hypothetical protein
MNELLHRFTQDPDAKPTKITLPTLHPDQVKAFNLPGRFKAIRCGRRWGKDVLINVIAAITALKGKSAGLFAPEYKQLTEPFDALYEMLSPLCTRSSRSEGSIKLTTGGNIDFWHTNDNELAGRGREYDIALWNEVSFSKPVVSIDIWKKSIRPTLLIRRGKAMFCSTPKGIDPGNLFYKACTDPELGFVEYHAPSNKNPLVSEEEFENERRTNDPLVFQQEYLAEFVDWSGAAFFSRDKLLIDGEPVPMPTVCDAVFAVVDTAIKTKTENDGTAVTFFARTKHSGFPLVVLDWDIEQIEGALLENWLPAVFQRLELLARDCGARFGSLGAFIEDKASGTILLQQGMRRGWPVQAIDSKLTAVGKDERAISVSGYHYQSLVKICREAYDKVTNYKGTSRNHFLGQVVGFRIGDKDASREDDLLDTYCYGLAIALGDRDGF